MQTWADIVKKQPLPTNSNTNAKNNITIGRVISVKTNAIIHPELEVEQEFSEKQDEKTIKNSIKHMDCEKITKLVRFRTSRNLNQQKFANLISVPYTEIRDVEQGKEISLSTYQSIFNYIDRHKLI